jgi:hypothetical protein
MRNRTNNKVLERKSNLLDLVLINIYRLLPEALSCTYYFLKIVDNYIRKVWVISLRERKAAKAAFKVWRRS